MLQQIPTWHIHAIVNQAAFGSIQQRIQQQGIEIFVLETKSRLPDILSTSMKLSGKS